MKAFDFQDWCKVADLMSYKKNLSLDGLDKILKIKNGMNTNRWVVEPVFTVRLHIKDVFLLKLIQIYFGVIGKYMYIII